MVVHRLHCNSAYWARVREENIPAVSISKTVKSGQATMRLGERIL